jgi:uncharacterized protein (UPF0335 family)
MPKPHGTFIASRIRDRIRSRAPVVKQQASVRRSAQNQAFRDAVHARSVEEFDEWHRNMVALVDRLKRGEPLDRDERIREQISEVLGQVREILEEAQELKSLQVKMRTPLEPVLRRPSEASGAGFDLAVIIALVRILEVLVRIRRGH